MSFVDKSPFLVGSSEIIRALDAEITAAARSTAKVLITGESGAGKEITARLVHERSPRRHMPLVTINCAGVPDSLLESELFGHVRGSFTGAYRDKPGLLETANGGTVFMDEVGEMSLRMQALLLRFLETGEIQRVGESREPVRVNVRVICATNRELPARVAAGDFREDLYYRLNVVNLHVPSLRERVEDLPELIEHFMAEFAERHRLPRPTIAEDARQRLLTHQWPGNVRELRNVIERMVVRAHGAIVHIGELPADVRLTPHAGAASTNGNGHAKTTAHESPVSALADAVARELFTRITANRESFWHVVHDAFVARDLTRDTMRRVVRLGLEQCGGNYGLLVEMFHLRKDEQKRLVGFLRKHDCLVSMPVSRPAAVAGTSRTQPTVSVA
ncbi:MAG: sigma-54-dependent Fis family transcriptional regulator [Acidobacteria bacterium]|nr:sigma-54-dependent Fis family transcriptional regulator [Acidobacteriota bacterium]